MRCARSGPRRPCLRADRLQARPVVGEFAVHLALAAGRKCFYTTPIKALSNQKYAELVERYGPGEVGLLTGDSSINSDAPVVVMTTEVLRNMLYANSEALRGLSHVVMDEVHYLADRFRGAVWEEVILHLSEDVRLVSLSATVSNAEEFGAWMETVRGDTTVVVDETRPIPLWQHIMVGRRIFDLFDSRSHPAAGPKTVLVDQDLVRHVKQRQALERVESWQPRGRGRRGSYQSSNDFRPLPRPDVIAQLDQSGLLPAITFIFSRAGCDAALAQCLRSRLDLTSPEQVREIDTIIEKHTGELPERGSRSSRISGLVQGITTRTGISPCRHAAGIPPDSRGTVRQGSRAGGLRDRDAGPRHQHAGTHGGARTSGQVQR